MTLATALNLDLNLPAFKLRERIKTATKELIQNKILMPKSGFMKDNKDVVQLIRYRKINIRHAPSQISLK